MSQSDPPRIKPSLPEDGVLLTQKMLTTCYHELVLLYAIQTVHWFGAANSRLKSHYQLLKENISQCHTLYGIQFLYKTLSGKSVTYSTCRIQSQIFVSRFMKTTFLPYQWLNHWNSLLAQNTLRSSIITFTAELRHPSTNQVISSSGISWLSSKKLIFLPSQPMMIAFSNFAICWVDGDLIHLCFQGSVRIMHTSTHAMFFAVVFKLVELFF